MDVPAPAEVLPSRYRAILDGIAVLEARGLRREAARIRMTATRTYSGAWDARALERLDELLQELSRLADRPTPSPASPGTSLHRSSLSG